MRNDFIKSIKVKNNLKKNRNVYSLQEKISKKMKVLIDAEEISKKIQEMAYQIALDYRGKTFALVCVEYGARDFYNLLVDNLHSLGITNFYQGAVKIERSATKTTNDRREPKFHFESGILCDKNKLKNLHILIIDDQISTGKTFELLKERYSNALSIELAALIVKSKAKKRLESIKYHSFLLKSRKRKSSRFWNGL